MWCILIIEKGTGIEIVGLVFLFSSLWSKWPEKKTTTVVSFEVEKSLSFMNRKQVEKQKHI